jgi:catechol 1,2-dioxygenase
MITAKGYQSLVTQLYFTGDEHIAKDVYSSSPNAKRRILDVQGLPSGTKKVVYNVGMSETLALEPVALEKIVGVYKNRKDQTTGREAFAKQNELWVKNDVYGERLYYIGDNTFEYRELAPGEKYSVHYEILASGIVEATTTYVGKDGNKVVDVWVKEK